MGKSAPTKGKCGLHLLMVMRREGRLEPWGPMAHPPRRSLRPLRRMRGLACFCRCLTGHGVSATLAFHGVRTRIREKNGMPKVLSEAEVAAYRDNGYHFPVNALSDSEVATFRKRLEDYEAESGGPIKGEM